ncbi:MAG: acylphosphatase [Proteobacteria bacterium]|nr:acylphosphatase [Pseudomonadota bacterium]
MRVTGLVQGVGYRAFVDREARRRGLEGWVRNRGDRSVEAVLAGPADVVADMIAVCRRGSSGSHVDDVDVVAADACALEVGRAGRFSGSPTLCRRRPPCLRRHGPPCTAPSRP